MLPLALGGALVAGISYGDVRRRPTGSRRTRRGARWARRRELRTLAVRPDAPPSGRLGARAATGPRFRRPPLPPKPPSHSSWSARPRAARRRAWRCRPFSTGPDPSWRPASRATSSATLVLARMRRGQVWCIDPTASTGLPASTWSPLSGCADWRRRLPGGRRSVRDGEGRRDDGRRRVLVRHGGQVPGAAASWPRPAIAAPWPTSCAGSTPRRWQRSPTSSSGAGPPRRWPRPRPPGVATSGRAARCRRRRRRSWRPSRR